MNQSGIRQRLVENGYSIVPVVGKSPVLKDWTKQCVGAGLDVVSSWDGLGSSTGIVHDGSVMCLDVDVSDGVLAGALRKRLQKRLAGGLLRYGRWPRFAYFFRAIEGLIGARTSVPLRWLAGGESHQIEIRGVGGQTVAYGEHPGGFDYEWTDSGDPMTVRACSLPSCSRDELEALLGELKTVVENHGRAGLQWKSAQTPVVVVGNGVGGGGTSEFGAAGTVDLVERLLAELPNDDLDWDAWFRVLLAVKGSLLDDEGAALGLFEAWSAESEKHDSAGLERWWDSITPHGAVGLGTLVWLARQADGGLPVGLEHDLRAHQGELIRARASSEFPAIEPDSMAVTVKIAGGAEGPEPSTTADELVSSGAFLSPASAWRSRVIPPEFLVEDVLREGGLNYVAGAPNIGKSVWLLDIMTRSACCVGSWGGKKIKPAVGIYLCQEGRDGFAARLAVWGQVNGQDPFEAPLFISDKWVGLARSADLPALAAEIRAVLEKLIAVGLIADQFVRDIDGRIRLVIAVDTQAASVPHMKENEAQEAASFLNGLQVLLIEGLSDLAVVTVVVVHHTRKDDPWVLRGSGAMAGAVENVVLLGPDETYPGYVKIVLGKAREAARETVLWAKPEGVPLLAPDGSGEEVRNELGDPVSVVSLRWVADLDADLVDDGGLGVFLQGVRSLAPPVGSRDIRRLLGKRSEETDKLRDLALDQGLLTDFGTDQRHDYRVTSRGEDYLLDHGILGPIEDGSEGGNPFE